MKVVCDYLEIEQARFGSRLRYVAEVPPEFDGVEVPPLSVQVCIGA